MGRVYARRSRRPSARPRAWPIPRLQRPRDTQIARMLIATTVPKSVPTPSRAARPKANHGHHRPQQQRDAQLLEDGP